MTLVRLNQPSLVRNLAHEAFFRNFADSYLEQDSNQLNNNVQFQVSELEDSYSLEIAIPGFSKEDLIVEVDNNVLRIATKPFDENEVRTGFKAMAFTKQFKLSKKVNQEAISAKSVNGVLTVTLPKVSEAIPKPVRKIEIS